MDRVGYIGIGHPTDAVRLTCVLGSGSDLHQHLAAAEHFLQIITKIKLLEQAIVICFHSTRNEFNTV